MRLRFCLLAVLSVLLVGGVAAQSDPPERVQVPSGISQGLLIYKVQPTYPPLARQARVQGTVALRAVIDKDGSIKDLTVISGHPMLIQAAMDAVKQWRYEPYYLNGEPVLVETTNNVNFTLEDIPSPAQPNQQVANSGNSAGQAASSPSAAVAAGQDVATLYANATSAFTTHNYGTAIPLATRVTEMDPKHHAAWNLLGLCYMELDELQKAEDAFKRQIEVSPEHPFAYNNLGRVYARQRKFDLAITQFRKQIEINPRDLYAHMNLGGSLRSEEKCDQAITEYKLAAELTPENTGPHLGLAQCYFDQKNQEAGLGELDKAAALTSTGPGWNALGWVMAEHHVQLDRAEQYAQRAVSMDSSSLAAVSLDPLTPGAYGRTAALAAAWDTLGWVLFLRGDLTSAEKYLMASWTLSRSPTNSDHLAQLSEKLGSQDDALRYSALAVAEGEGRSEANDSDVLAVSSSRERLTRLAPSSVASKALQDAQRWVDQRDSFAVPNPAKHTGSAEFALLWSHGQSAVKARWMAGDSALKDFEGEVAARAPAIPAETGSIDLLRWGSLNCGQSDTECHFRLYPARGAVYAQLRAGAGQYPGVYRVGGGVSAPKTIYAPDPQYSDRARKAGFEGTVVLWLIVDADGLPQNIRVQRPLGMGLDEEAIAAVKQWRFQPALKDGKPVPVMINVQVNFRLYREKKP
jgi:TonB family protein